MVHKIMILKIFIVAVAAIIAGFFVFSSKCNIETNLLKTLLSENVENSQDIIKIVNNESANIKVVFESDSEKNLENLKQNFIKNIDKNDFEIKNNSGLNIVKAYVSAPTNFLSDNDKNLLIDEKYDEIYEKSLEKLYNPAWINLSDFDKDPFMLLDDYIFSLGKAPNSVYFDDGKYYDSLILKIISTDGLSPDLSNKKMKKIINLQQKLSDKYSKIYLGGTPVHSYYTSKNAIYNINIICILSIFLIAFLTYFYFKNLKFLVFVFLAISYGMFIGYCVTRFRFSDFQIITLVFSTMLIGIGIDYSYHYFFTKNHGKIFIRNLTFSLLTTIIPFVLLYLSGIELLRQIAVFSTFGLAAIYLFVVLIYPCFKFDVPQKCVKISFKYFKILAIIIIIFSLAGIFRLKFNDNLDSLYTPSKQLLKAEKLYNRISGQTNFHTQFLVVRGKNLQDILEKEEIVADKLAQKNIDYISLSKFIPTEQKQKENFKLVKKLYDKKLNNYNKILTPVQISKLKMQTFKPVFYDEQNLDFLSDFLVDKNSSLVVIFSDKNINIGEKTINIQRDISQYLKTYRQILIKIFPVVLFLIYIFLSVIFGVKKGIKLILPSFFGTICAFGATLLIFGELNLFSVIAMFLVLGFTIDYSIFREKGDKQTEDAILVSCITTAFSFLMLSLTGFKLISSITFMLFIGIISSYIIGYLVFNKNKD